MLLPKTKLNADNLLGDIHGGTYTANRQSPLTTTPYRYDCYSYIAQTIWETVYHLVEYHQLWQSTEKQHAVVYLN